MRAISWFIVAIVATASPAFAQQGEQSSTQDRPEALTRVLACRALQSEQERLACYDQSVAALEQAEASRDLVVMDREQLRRTRRTLFGFALPDLNIFGGGDDDDPETVTELNATIRSATLNPLGKWIFVLEDGARWIQIDSRELRRDARGGQPIRIRRAAMGSYMANVDGQIAIRVRRVQ